MEIVFASRATIPYPAANGISIVHFCNGLAKLGHEVTLALGWKVWRKKYMHISLEDYYGLDVDFKVKRFFELPKVGFNIVGKIIDFAENKDPLIITRDLCFVEPALRRGLICILDCHQLFSPADLSKIEFMLENDLGRGLVTVTETMRDHLISELSSGVPRNKIIVAPNGLDCQRLLSLEIPEERGLSSNSPAVGYMGSFFPGKGLEVIVPLAERMPDTRFVVCGPEATMQPDVKKRLLGIGNLEYKGYVRPAGILYCLSEFSVALLPNQPSVFIKRHDIGSVTSPVKLFEYMAAGRAIVASDLPVIREVIKDGEDGLLVGHDDLDGWEGAVRLLLADNKLRIRLARRARQRAAEEYSHEARARKVLKLVDSNG